MPMTPAQVEELIRRVIREEVPRVMEDLVRAETRGAVRHELAEMFRRLSLKPSFKGAKLRDPAMQQVWKRWRQLCVKHNVTATVSLSGAPPGDIQAAIKARLRKYTADQLEQALESLFQDKWTKDNQAFDPMRVLRQDSRVERFLGAGKPTRSSIVSIRPYEFHKKHQFGKFGGTWDETSGELREWTNKEKTEWRLIATRRSGPATS